MESVTTELQTNFWCSIIMKWLDPGLTEPTKTALESYLPNANEERLLGIIYLLRHYDYEQIFSAIDLIDELLRRADAVGEECYSCAYGSLHSSIFSGSWGESGLGEPSRRWTGIVAHCDSVLTAENISDATRKAFRLIKKDAEKMNERKLLRDKLEVEEEGI